MNETLLEQLLNEDESSSLDFKREQYLFIGTTKDQKSEIIKDIVAFANAWRRTDAYILMGVEEVCGGRSIVNGVTQHLDEADLQQLVNSNTRCSRFQPFVTQTGSSQLRWTGVWWPPLRYGHMCG